MSDRGGVFVQQQPHRDAVQFIRLESDAIFKLSRELSDPIEADALQVQIDGIGRGRVVTGVDVVQDMSEMRQARGRVVHGA